MRSSHRPGRQLFISWKIASPNCFEDLWRRLGPGLLKVPTPDKISVRERERERIDSCEGPGVEETPVGYRKDALVLVRC